MPKLLRKLIKKGMGVENFLNSVTVVSELPLYQIYVHDVRRNFCYIAKHLKLIFWKVDAMRKNAWKVLQ